MERRKFLIGAGTLGAGASAALGTGAFTTVEAQRNADVSVAGDASALVTVEAADSANAEEFVSTESDGTVSVTLPNVNNDAVTTVDDLLTLQNNGTQTVDVFFQDSSEAVQFRSNGSSIEGPEESVALEVGEEIVVGLTVNTLNNEVSGQLLDSVTIVATADDPQPGANASPVEFNLVVDPSRESFDDEKYFETLDDALAAASPSDSIGIQTTETLESPVTVDVPDVTIAGMSSGVALDGTGLGLPDEDELINVTADGVTLEDLDIDYSVPSVPASDRDGPHAIRGVKIEGLTLEGLTINNTTGNETTSVVDIRGTNFRLLDNTVNGGGALQVQHDGTEGSGTVNIVGNTVTGSGTVREGIVAFSFRGGSLDDHDYVITGNTVEDAPANAIKLEDLADGSTPASVNGQSAQDDQLAALLSDNDVSTAEINGSVGTAVSNGSSEFGSVQAAVDAAGENGLTLVQSGAFEESVTLDTDGFSLRGPNANTAYSGDRAEEVTITAPSGERAIGVTGAGVEVSGLRIEGAADGVIFVSGSGGTLTGKITVTNNIVRADSTSGSGRTGGVVVSSAANPGGPAKAEIRGNDIESGKGAAVNVFNGSTHDAITVVNNEIRGDPGGLRDIDTLDVRGNDIFPLASPDKALDVSGVNSATITGNTFAGGSGERAFNDDGGNQSGLLNTVLDDNTFDPSGVINTGAAEILFG